jgi:uncharacterized membrane protein YvlD (DUF360 family)
MSAMLWRILIAVIVVVIIGALIAPVSRILGFPVDGDVLLVLRICIAGLAVLYILRGPPFPAA